MEKNITLITKSRSYLNDGNCTKCSDEICLNFIYENGKEYCNKCIEAYKINEEKCSLCSDLEVCIDCYFKNGKE